MSKTKSVKVAQVDANAAAAAAVQPADLELPAAEPGTNLTMKPPAADKPIDGDVTQDSVVFWSRRADQEIDLGAKKFKFSGTRLVVSAADAELIKSHHLYTYQHIFADEEVLVDSAGRIQQVRKDAGMLKKAKDDGKSVFVFPEMSRGKITLAGSQGLFDVEVFNNTVITDNKEVAQLLRGHTFFAQGRLTEL